MWINSETLLSRGSPLQKVILHLRVEALAIAVLPRRARLDVNRTRADARQPPAQLARLEIRPVIRPHMLRHGLTQYHVRQDFDHSPRRGVRVLADRWQQLLQRGEAALIAGYSPPAPEAILPPTAERYGDAESEERFHIPRRRPRDITLSPSDGSCVRLRTERMNHIWACEVCEPTTGARHPSLRYDHIRS